MQVAYWLGTKFKNLCLNVCTDKNPSPLVCMCLHFDGPPSSLSATIYWMLPCDVLDICNGENLVMDLGGNKAWCLSTIKDSPKIIHHPDHDLPWYQVDIL